MPGGRPRTFPHNEARTRYADGESISDLAAKYGTTPGYLQLVVTGQYERQLAYKREWAKTTCGDCGGPAQKVHFRGEYPRCIRCAGIARATSARPEVLQCGTCRKWKPDKAFAHNRVEKHGRRGRHSQCTACNTAAKRAWRERQRDGA